MDEQNTLKACSEQRYDVLRSDLPLSCPTAAMTAWDAHPKIYLDIAAMGEVLCPYCGALYVLVDKKD